MFKHRRTVQYISSTFTLLSNIYLAIIKSNNIQFLIDKLKSDNNWCYPQFNNLVSYSVYLS